MNRIVIVAFCSMALSGGLGHGRVTGEPQWSAFTSTSRSAVRFKVVNSGEIATEYGVHLGFTAFKSADGVGLTVFYLTQNDPVHASQAFNEELARAVKVMERGVKKDRNGNAVGERAQILTPSTILIPPFPAVAGPQIPAVVWTDGPTFHEIKSSSLQNVLEFEKVYRY